MAQLLRADLLPGARIAPPAVRQLRALLRHRIQLVRLRTLLRNRIHAVLAGHGQDRAGGCWSGTGRQWLAALELPAASREVAEDDLALIDDLQQPAGRPGWEIRCEQSHNSRHPPPDGRGDHRARPARPLDNRGPHGCGYSIIRIGLRCCICRNLAHNQLQPLVEPQPSHT